DNYLATHPLFPADADQSASAAALPAAASSSFSNSDLVTFDETYYLNAHPEVRQAIQDGQYPSAIAHYLTIGAGLGYAPNATQTVAASDLAIQVTDPASLPYSAHFTVPLGSYAGDGVSAAEQQMIGLINADRTAGNALAVDATLSDIAYRRAVDLV